MKTLHNMELVNAEKISFKSGGESWALSFMPPVGNTGVLIWLVEDSQFFADDWESRVGVKFSLDVNQRVDNNTSRLKTDLISFREVAVSSETE